MPEQRHCPACGAALPGNAPPALSPAAAPDALAADPASEETALGPLPTLKPPAPVEEAAGHSIGRYKLLEKIGEGGFGDVWIAEQRDPVRRRVALKILKRGLDTKQVVARFEAERQALALMDHPNIAKVLDGGATDSGRPFFVMELVNGVKITDYCDQHKVPTQERLILFRQVCHAIQHAHQKGIIHRDIKPGNILVAMQDGVPVPKVIDFGIAKAIHGNLTDKTIYTEIQQFIGTPAYMSPEQVEMTSLDIDTRADIYSLGVVLYELLTGATPFETEDLLRAGLDEMRRIIREVDPPRPSARLSTLDGASLRNEAKSHGAEPPKLIHLVRGDLDWIVMKALEKDRTRRYDSATSLAMEIDRYLNGEAVLASPPSKIYLLRKTVRRHKAAFATAALFAVVLVTATIVSLRQAALAKERLAEAEAISKYLTEVFRSPDPSVDGRSVKVVDVLGPAASNLDSALGNQPAARARVQGALGATYWSLGLYPQAIQLQEQALKYYAANASPLSREAITATHNLALSYSDSSRLDEAIKLDEQALASCRKAFGPNSTNALVLMNSLAATYDIAGRRYDALALLEEAVAIGRRNYGEEYELTVASMNTLANVYDHLGRRDDALKLSEQVLPLYRKRFGPESHQTLTAMNNLAVSYDEVGRNAEAMKLREAVLPLDQKVLGLEHPDTIMAMTDLAISYDRAARHDEAIKLGEEALALDRKVLGLDHADTLTTMTDLGAIYEDASRLQDALNIREQSYSLHLKKFGPNHAATIEAMYNLSMSYDEVGRKEEALKMGEQVVTLSRKFLGPDDSEILDALDNLAGYYAEAGRDSNAMTLLTQEYEARPRQGSVALKLAAWQAWFDRPAEYKSFRLKILQNAQGNDDADFAQAAAEACGLLPALDSTSISNTLTLAQKAMALAKKETNAPPAKFQFSLGLAEFRATHYSAAIDLLAAAEQGAGDTNKELKGTAGVYRAMALAAAGRPDAGRKLFREAETLIPPFPKDDSKPVLNGNLASTDQMIWWIAYAEAKMMMNTR